MKQIMYGATDFALKRTENAYFVDRAGLIRVPVFTRWVYIGHDPSLAQEAMNELPRNFRRPSFRKALDDCGKFICDRVA